MEASIRLPGYEILEILGRGGFGVVYRARQLAVGRDVAVKIDGRVLATERERRRFLREVTAAGQLSSHPHVVALYDAGTLTDGRPYLVMEMCPGGSLDTLLRNAGPMSPDEVRRLGMGVADALATAHAAGILHRDVKPANILLNQYGVAGLSDFGLASILDADGGQSATREALTPAYAAPEAFQLEDPTDRFDVYSLAATLYALVAGRPPRFPESGRPSIATILALHDAPVEDVPGVPPELTAVLRQALATDPAARPTVAGFRDLLAGLGPEVTTGDPVEVRRFPGGGVPMVGPPVMSGPPAPTAPPLHIPAPAPRHVPPVPPIPSTAIVTDRNVADVPPPRDGRRRRTALRATTPVVLLLGLVLLSIPGLHSVFGSGKDTASSAGTDNNGSDTAGSGTGTGTTDATAVGSTTLTGGRDCPASLEDDSATCPMAEECWGGMVLSSGVLTSVASKPCAEEHFWETFALLPIPEDAGITDAPVSDKIAASPTVQQVCSIDVLSPTLSGPAADLPLDTWKVDILPPTQAQFDSGERTVRCILTVDGKTSLGSAVYPDDSGYTPVDF
jgi:hypothetical protein